MNETTLDLVRRTERLERSVRWYQIALLVCVGVVRDGVIYHVSEQSLQRN